MMEMLKNKWVVCLASFALLAGAGIFGVVDRADALTTQVMDIWPSQPGNPGSEWNLFDNSSGNPGIMGYLYSSYIRIDDAEDDEWKETNGGATAIAIFAGADQQLGYRYSGADTDLGPQLTSGITPPSTTVLDASFNVPGGGPFIWYDDASGCCSVLQVFSDPSLNGDRDGDFVDDDHMVSFQILEKWVDPDDHSLGVNKLLDTYVIAFEDIPFDSGSDKDYNDLVVEVSEVMPTTCTNCITETPVPEPATLLLLGSGMAVFGFSRRRRRE